MRDPFDGTEHGAERGQTGRPVRVALGAMIAAALLFLLW